MARHETRYDFFFRVWTDGEDCVDSEVFYPGLEMPSPNERPVTEWIRESFSEEDFFYLFKLDKTKNWQVVGSATICGWHDYDGEYDECIDIEKFVKCEVPAVEDASRSMSSFEEHLQAASKIVSSWPAWRQSVLGDSPLLKRVNEE